MRKWLLILITVVMLPMVAFSQEKSDEQHKEDMWREIESRKVAFFTHELRITSEEAVLFWPLYNDMTWQIQKLHWEKRKLRKSLFNNGDKPTEEQCKEVLKKILELDKKRDELKYTSYKKMSEVIPASKLLRLEDVEEHFRQKLFDYLRKRSQKNPPEMPSMH